MANKKSNTTVDARKKAQAQLQRRKKQQKKQTMILGIILSAFTLVVIGLIAFFVIQGMNEGKPNNEEATSCIEKANSLTKPAIASEDGAITINATSIVDKQQAESSGIVIEELMDPICPACGNTIRLFGDSIKKGIKEGKISYAIHPVGLMDHFSNGDEYSSKMSAAIISAAETDPSKVMDFLEIIFDAKNQPSESNYKAVPNGTIQLWLTKAGYTEAQAQDITSGKYLDWVKATTEAVQQSEKYFHKDQNGEPILSTPQFFVNGQWLEDYSGLKDIDKFIETITKK